MKIKQMPRDLRPDERALLFGTEALNDAELLAIILRTGTAGKSSLEIASEILAIDKGKDGLGNVAMVTYSDLCKIKGLGKVKALQVASVCELGRRISSGRTERTLLMDSPGKAAAYVMESTRYLDHEEAYVLLTDTHNRLIRSVQIAQGSLDAAVVSPREIMKAALSYNASGFILVHNHPSGRTDPSGEDLRFCRQLKEASSLMNVRFHDSIIIGDGEYLSMKEQGTF